MTIEQIKIMLLVKELTERISDNVKAIGEILTVVGANTKLIEVITNDKGHIEEDIRKLKDKIKRLEND